MNQWIGVGRLGDDPEVKTVGQGNDLARFSMATSKYWKDKEGQKQESTVWHKVTAWGYLAKRAQEKLQKGSEVMIVGEYQTRSYEDNEGKKRYVSEVVAKDIKPISNTKQSSGSGVPNMAPGMDEEIPF